MINNDYKTENLYSAFNNTPTNSSVNQQKKLLDTDGSNLAQPNKDMVNLSTNSADDKKTKIKKAAIIIGALAGIITTGVLIFKNKKEPDISNMKSLEQTADDFIKDTQEKITKACDDIININNKSCNLLDEIYPQIDKMQGEALTDGTDRIIKKVPLKNNEVASVMTDKNGKILTIKLGQTGQANCEKYYLNDNGTDIIASLMGYNTKDGKKLAQSAVINSGGYNGCSPSPSALYRNFEGNILVDNQLIKDESFKEAFKFLDSYIIDKTKLSNGLFVDSLSKIQFDNEGKITNGTLKTKEFNGLVQNGKITHLENNQTGDTFNLINGKFVS